MLHHTDRCAFALVAGLLLVTLWFGPAISSSLNEIERGSITLQTASAPPWLIQAREHLGTNPGYWSKPWCGAYLSVIMPGPLPKLSRRVAPWLDYGLSSEPRPGAVVVMERHVGLVERCNSTHCLVISGNERGELGRVVNHRWYKRSAILDFRWPHQ